MTIHYGLVLEVEDKCPLIDNIDYCAKTCERQPREKPETEEGDREKSTERRKQERGTRQTSEIIIETYTTVMSSNRTYSGATSGGASSKSSTRSLMSRESTPAGGSKDFPPLAGVSREGSSLAGVSREGSSQSGVSREGSASRETHSKESTPSDRSRHRSTKNSTPCDPDFLNFISGNPFVEVTKGVIHLFKDAVTREYESTEMMCIYGVPAKHKTCDLLQFTAPCHADLEYLRIIHDGSPNQYMVLLKFRSAHSAAEFHAAYNGLQYNTLEPDICSVLPVSWVELCKETDYETNPDACTELPYCTICLERMDENVSTVLTILCNHKFHSVCLAQWEDPTCPVCRHVQTPEVTTEHVCSDCQSSNDLWICLVCGYVGCGRYAGGHAHAHFTHTQHCYSMELGHNRVWDYVGDNFVHRLVQNTSDGKLVEQEAGEKVGQEHVGGVQVNSDEKMDSLQLEYTYLLTSQLESQRDYFENKVRRLEEEAARESREATLRVKTALEQKIALEARLEELTKDKNKNDHKLLQLTAKFGKLNSALDEEKQLNQSLTQNQDDWQKRLKKAEIELNVINQQKDLEISDLKEQVRDLMFFLEAQETIKESPMRNELAEGSVTVGEGAQASADSTPRKPGKAARKRKS